MPSEAAKKRKEKKKVQAQGRGKPVAKAAVNGAVNGAEKNTNGTVEEQMSTLAITNLSVTGVLESHPESRDCHLGQITLRYHGAELLVDAKVELNCGRRYCWVRMDAESQRLCKQYHHVNFLYRSILIYFI